MHTRYFARFVLFIYLLVSIITTTALAQSLPASPEHLFLDIPFYVSLEECSDMLANYSLELLAEDSEQYQVAVISDPSNLPEYGAVSCVDFHFDNNNLFMIFLLYPNCDIDSANTYYVDIIRSLSSKFGAPTDAYLLTRADDSSDAYYNFPDSNIVPDIGGAIGILSAENRNMTACVVFDNIEMRVSVNNEIQELNKYAISISFYSPTMKPSIPDERLDY